MKAFCPQENARELYFERETGSVELKININFIHVCDMR